MLGNTRQDASTMNGEAGIIPNAVADLFGHITTLSSTGSLSLGERWDVLLTYIEVYNEQVHNMYVTAYVYTVHTSTLIPLQYGHVYPSATLCAIYNTLNTLIHLIHLIIYTHTGI